MPAETASSQKDPKTQRFAILNEAISQVMFLQPHIEAVTVLFTTTQPTAPKPEICVVTRDGADGKLTPPCVVKMLEAAVNYVGELTTALGQVTQEFDRAIAARTRQARELADAEKAKGQSRDDT